jgi:sec-independent protein translocase protein TatA
MCLYQSVKLAYEEALMFRSIGLPELLVILLVFMVLFGGKKLADVGKGLGEGIRNFKTSLKGDEPPDDKKQA